MNNEEGREHRQRHGRYGFIPAGVLIGLGIGLLAGYPGSGVLIGLGIGFLASGLVPMVTRTTASGETGRGGKDIPMLLLGVFMILIGVGIVWAPAVLWPYLAAGFLILLGIWFLVRGFYHAA